MSLFGALAELERSGEAGAVCTIIRTRGSTPRHQGSKMLVYADGRFMGTVGGGEIENRVIQEALNNIAKHARASTCQITLICREAGFTLKVTDDGQGFDLGAAAPDSLGLGIMRDRAEGIGARLTIESELERGTEVIMEWNQTEKDKE